jgi:hypothetical protein
LLNIWVFWGEFVLARAKEKAKLTTKDTTKNTTLHKGKQGWSNFAADSPQESIECQHLARKCAEAR